MRINEDGVELNKEEAEELKKTGYVLNDICSVCIVNHDGKLLIFRRNPLCQLSIYDYEEVK